MAMMATELIESWIARLETERQQVSAAGRDAPIVASQGRHLTTKGGVHLYEFIVPSGVLFPVDLPLSILPSDESDPTEGLVLHQKDNAVLMQALDALGEPVPSVTLIPDMAGFLSTSAARLRDMVTRTDAYQLGPAERLASVLQVPEDGWKASAPASSVLKTLWLDERSLRRQKLASLAIDLIRANKHILLLSPDHVACDEIMGGVARAMKAGGLNYKMWITRYDIPITAQSHDIDLQELGFEAQMHQFYARSQTEKASLRQKYERFRELAPFLALKGQKQKDLDEVRSLEWRLVTELRDVQVKIAEVSATLTEYERLPLLQRLGMQAVGKNVESLKQYRVLYQQQVDHLDKECDLVKARIQRLMPEATIPREIRQEADELKGTIERLGGSKKVRELLAAEEDPNRQAFMQNRRLVAATPSRVATDPLFSRMRFDILIADEAPWIAAASLMAAAGLVQERIVISGDPRDIAAAGFWTMNDTSVRATG